MVCWVKSASVGRAAALAIATTAAVPVVANAAPLESPVEVRINPSDPAQWVVRYEYIGGGLLLSDDGGASWKLLCNIAIDPKVNKETNGLEISNNGEIFTGSFKGMWRVSANGCESQHEQTFGEQWISDLSGDPSDPNFLYAVTSGSQQENGIVRYDGASDSWTPLGTTEAINIGRIRAVPSEQGLRFYESIAGGEMKPDPETGTETFVANVTLRYSDDQGESWTEFVSFEGSAGIVALEAVDPTNPDRIVISETFGRDDPRMDRLFINDRAGDGEAHQLIAELERFGGAAFGPNGELWFSDADGSVSLLAQGASVPEVMWPDVEAHCLRYAPETATLLACKAFSLEELLLDGTTKTVLDFNTVSQWVTCDNGLDVPAACAPRLRLQGWCGPTHFPESGVCAAYCYPGRSVESDAEAMAQSAQQCDPTMASTPTTEGGSSTPTMPPTMPSEPDNGLVPTTETATPEAPATAGTTGTGAESGDTAKPAEDGGCSVGGSKQGSGRGTLLCLLTALVAVRTRGHRLNRRRQTRDTP